MHLKFAQRMKFVAISVAQKITRVKWKYRSGRRHSEAAAANFLLKGFSFGFTNSFVFQTD